MRKIVKRFDEAWAKAQKRNVEEDPACAFEDYTGGRFYRIYEQRKRYVTMGIYDRQTGRYALFDTINLVGNFRYDPKVVPPEVEEMYQIASQP
jgi:hypothetical protein